MAGAERSGGEEDRHHRDTGIGREEREEGPCRRSRLIDLVRMAVQPLAHGLAQAPDGIGETEAHQEQAGDGLEALAENLDRFESEDERENAEQRRDRDMAKAAGERDARGLPRGPA